MPSKKWPGLPIHLVNHQDVVKKKSGPLRIGMDSSNGVFCLFEAVLRHLRGVFLGVKRRTSFEVP